VLKHKSGNISETRKDRWKVTMESLWEVRNALSNGNIPDPLRTANLAGMFSGSIRT